MIKGFLGGVFGAFLMLLGIHQYLVYSYVEPAKEVSPIEAVVETLNQSIIELQNKCSGVVIDKEIGLVATAWHCVYTTPEEAQIMILRVYNEDGTIASERKIFGYVIGMHSNTDVAIIKLNDGTQLSYEAKISSDVVKLGDRVYSAGYSNMWKGVLTEGIIAMNNFVWDVDFTDGLMKRPNFKAYLASAQLSGGGSGGPVFNDKGEIIGLSNWTHPFRRFGGAAFGGDIGSLLTGITPSENILKLEKEVKHKLFRDILRRT